jgi:hypothetical protein
MKTLLRFLSAKAAISFPLLVSLLFLSCEEVIDLDLSGVENQIVIEGTISETYSGSRVKLSFAASAFKKSQPRAATGAVVTLRDDLGNSETLNEIQPGIYAPTSILGAAHRTYTLTVEFGGQRYSAMSTMPAPMSFDSIRSIPLYYDPRFANPVALEYYLSNQPGVEEYCLIKAYQPNDNTVYWTIYSDKYSDGKQVVLDGPAFFSANPTILVDLISIDKATYEYFYALRQITGGDGLELPDLLAINEYNPKSNLTNNALGYFSAQAQTTYVLTRE